MVTTRIATVPPDPEPTPNPGPGRGSPTPAPAGSCPHTTSNTRPPAAAPAAATLSPDCGGLAIGEDDRRVGFGDAEIEAFFQIQRHQFGVVPGITDREVLPDVEDEVTAPCCSVPGHHPGREPTQCLHRRGSWSDARATDSRRVRSPRRCGCIPAG